MPRIEIAPSVLPADFARLGEEVAALEAAGVDRIQWDVMDGQFVPPITMGPLVVSALADQVKAAGAILDVHLMIDAPESQVEAFADAGADTFVAGSAIFGKPDYKAVIDQMRVALP